MTIIFALHDCGLRWQEKFILHCYSSMMGLRTTVAEKINASLLFIHYGTVDRGSREN